MSIEHVSNEYKARSYQQRVHTNGSLAGASYEQKGPLSLHDVHALLAIRLTEGSLASWWTDGGRRRCG